MSPTTGLTKANAIRTILIAPCGMNCRLCRAYGRDKNPCPGCRDDDSVKPKTRVFCRIKNCEKRRQGKNRYCFSCGKFPCDILEHLDKRYRSRYSMSMIENLRQIKRVGIRLFVMSEEKKWSCPECGRLLCVHMPQCPSCGRRWR